MASTQLLLYKWTNQSTKGLVVHSSHLCRAGEGLEKALVSVLDSNQMSGRVMAQLRLLCYLREDGALCFRELLAKACLELTTGEIYLALYRLEGLNALKNERLEKSRVRAPVRSLPIQ